MLDLLNHNTQQSSKNSAVLRSLRKCWESNSRDGSDCNGRRQGNGCHWPGQVPPSDEYFLEAKETNPSRPSWRCDRRQNRSKLTRFCKTNNVYAITEWRSSVCSTIEPSASVQIDWHGCKPKMLKQTLQSCKRGAPSWASFRQTNGWTVHQSLQKSWKRNRPSTAVMLSRQYSSHFKGSLASDRFLVFSSNFKQIKALCCSTACLQVWGPQTRPCLTPLLSANRLDPTALQTCRSNSLGLFTEKRCQNSTNIMNVRTTQSVAYFPWQE